MPDLAKIAPHETECSTCRETDNHPTMHYGDRRFHFDCVPADVLADILDSVSADERKRIETVIARATANGDEHLYGEALRKLHVDLDPKQPADVKAAVAELAKGDVNG